MSLKYVILTAEEAENIEFDKVLENSAETLRWNAAKTETFVKYETGSKPSFLTGKTALTESQMLTIVVGVDWSPGMP